MWHLNSVYAANLLAASADGAVRVWRNHTFRTQRLSTAWQVQLPSRLRHQCAGGAKQLQCHATTSASHWAHQQPPVMGQQDRESFLSCCGAGQQSAAPIFVSALHQSRLLREHTLVWQAVPITPGCILGGALQPATFECSELHGALFASGGTQPTIVQQWDMHREQLSQHVNPPGAEDLGMC